MTWDIARLAGLIKRDHARKGTTLAVTDSTIAAIAISQGCVLFTDNAKDFPMKELQLYLLTS